MAFGERGRVSDEPSREGSIGAAVPVLGHPLPRSQRYAVMTSSAYNGPEFIDPGCPWQNGFLESFQYNLRDEPLDPEVFVSVAEA